MINSVNMANESAPAEKTPSTTPGPVTVDRRNNLSYEEFRKEYLLPRKPVIITDATAGWGASSWTPDFFRQKYPNKLLMTDQGEMRMEDFIDAITIDSDKPGPFLREQPLKDVFPELVDHVEPTPSYVSPNWLGGNYLVGSITRRLNRESFIEVNFCGRRIFPYLHIDDLGVHAFITQHYGEKEVIIYPPDQEKYLYRKPGSRFSEIVDVDHPDLERYPLFANATAARVVVKPGETAFMPSGWWHTTRVPGTSLSTVISVSNSSNWSELVDCLQNASYRPRLFSVFAIYLRGLGFLRSSFS
jgi:histone arginine demethylase JMJD6